MRPIDIYELCETFVERFVEPTDAETREAHRELESQPPSPASAIYASGSVWVVTRKLARAPTYFVLIVKSPGRKCIFHDADESEALRYVSNNLELSP